MLAPEIYWVPEMKAARLAVMPRPRGDDWLGDEVSGWHAAGIDHVVSLLEMHEVRELGLAEEAALCEQNGVGFVSFPIADRSVPSSLHAAAGLIRSIEARLAQGEAVAIHCRAGIGRSGLMAACVLVNLGVPQSEVFPRISRGRGIQVPDTPAQVEWLARYARERNNAL